MKEYISELVDSIEGYGNILVTKPNGKTKKYSFTNTITDHFRKNMMYAILYGDTENENDPENRYYYSNKMLAYRFKVTVGPETDNGSADNTSELSQGSAKELTFSAGSAGNKSIGESRISRIGTIDTNQSLISSVMGDSPYHIAAGLQEELKGFDFDQQVFVGMQSIGGGQTAPLFRAARENLRWLKGTDGSWQRLALSTDVKSSDATHGYNTSSGATKDGNGAKILNAAIDSPSSKTAYWDSYTNEEFGVQSTIRQTMGASTWKVATWRLLKEDKEEEILKLLSSWYASTHEILPKKDDFKKNNVSLLWHNAEKFIVTDDFYRSDFLPGSYSEFFNENSFELQDPEGANYWSFVDPIDQWKVTRADYEGRDVDNMIGGARIRGRILAIEVQNFVGASSENEANTNFPETLAFHIPTSNPIIIDRNDNVTVEYNFKFTKPTSAVNTELQWNIAYIDNLARAINPVGGDLATGINSQYANRATPIQLTGAALFEKDILEARDSKTKVANWSILDVGNDLIGTQGPDALDNYPNRNETTGLVQWKQGDWYATDGGERTISVPAAPAKIARKASTWGLGGTNAIVSDTTITRTEKELDFWRVWTSRTSDLWTEVTDSDAPTLNDFTNVTFYPSLTDAEIALIEDKDNVRRRGSYDEGHFVHNLYKKYNSDSENYDENTVIDRRSYNSQLEFTPCFRHIISAVVDDPGNAKYLWSVIDTDNPLNTVVGNHFDYFKHMVSDRNDNTFILSLSGNTWSIGGDYNASTAVTGTGNVSSATQRFISALNFDNRRCQIWITPYGVISDNILRHAAKTNWIKDTNYYLPNGDVDGDNSNPQSMLNVDTLWQNGIRMVNSDPNTSFSAQEAIAMAVSKLSPASTKEGNDTYVVRDQEFGENDFKSKIAFKATSDSRFVSPPRFFKVMYGETGHFVPKDLQDSDTQSKWLLRDDHIDLMSEKFEDLRDTSEEANWEKTNDQFFSDVYNITLYKDEKGTESDGQHYIHGNIKVKPDIKELMDQLNTHAATFDTDDLPAYTYRVREGDNYIGEDIPDIDPVEQYEAGDIITISDANYTGLGYGGNGFSSTQYSKGDGWEVDNDFWIQADPKYVELLPEDEQPINDLAKDGNAGIELNFQQDFNSVDTGTNFHYSDALGKSIEDAMGNSPPQTEFNIKPGTGSIPYASTMFTLSGTSGTPEYKNLDYQELTHDMIQSSVVRYTFGESKAILSDVDSGDTIIISDDVSGSLNDIRLDAPVYYGGVGRPVGQTTGFNDSGNYGYSYFGTANWDKIKPLLQAASRVDFAQSTISENLTAIQATQQGYTLTNGSDIPANAPNGTEIHKVGTGHFLITLPDNFDADNIGDGFIFLADAKLKPNHTTEVVGDVFTIEYEIPAGEEKKIDIAHPIHGILGKKMLDSYDFAPGQVTNDVPDDGEWAVDHQFTLLYSITNTEPVEYVWKKYDTFAIEGLHKVKLESGGSSRNIRYGSVYEVEHDWMIGSIQADARENIPDKNEFVYIDPSADTPNPQKWAAISDRERIILYNDIGAWCEEHALEADDRTFNAIPIDDFVWNYVYNDDVAPFNIYSYHEENNTYRTLYKGSDNTLESIPATKPKLEQIESMKDGLSAAAQTIYDAGDSTVLNGGNDNELGALVHPEIQEMYRPFSYLNYASFSLLRSMVMKHKQTDTLPTATVGWDDNHSDRTSELRTLAKWFHPTNNPLGASLDEVYNKVRTEMDKCTFNDDHKSQDEILLALIRHFAPFGMMDFYFWDDETPDRMSLSFPDPKQDMFYGLIANPGGADMADDASDPTWTQGDKVEMMWTINPPVTGSI